jgi:hypothetical protein
MRLMARLRRAAGAGPDATAVLEEGHVADIVQPVLDGPVVSDELEQLLRRGLIGRQTGDEIGDLDTFPALDPASARDPGDLGQARPGEIGNDLPAHRDAAGFDTAMALVERLGKAQIRRVRHRGEASPKAILMFSSNSG